MKFIPVTLLAFASWVVALKLSGDFGPVDLGYAIHVPTYVQTTTESNLTYAAYTNIRFAQSPTGNRRFRRPHTPPPHSEHIQDGKYPLNYTDCLITIPSYYPLPGLNGTSWGHEDCLFLDVLVPEAVKKGDRVPVLHWLYGSQYAFGSKTWSADVAALFQVVTSSQEKFIIVSSNYRLGAMGWVSGPGIEKNIGIWDGLAAVEWTQKYIEQFGGDPERITLMGESSGGGITEHLITGWGGKNRVPFHQAILTSPAFMPHHNTASRMSEMYSSLLAATKSNCSTVDCLRELPESTISAANAAIIVNQPPGFVIGPGMGFGPIIDHVLVPDLPTNLISQGRYHRSVKKILTANMVDDGDFGFVAGLNWTRFLQNFMQMPTHKTVSRVTAWYPKDEQNPTAPFNNFATDTIFACNSQALAHAWAGSAYRYVMSIPPGTHGLDQQYIFYYDAVTTPVIPASKVGIARRLQRYLRNFILYGDPNGGETRSWNMYAGNATHAGSYAGASEAPSWPTYGQNNIINITSSGFAAIQDPLTKDTCEFIRSLINDPENGF